MTWMRRGIHQTKNMPAEPTPTFIDDYLPALLAQASQLISTEFHEVVRRHNLSVTEWRILSTLLGAGEISIGNLAQVTLTKQPTVTRLLDRLETLGHLRRIAHESDRRITLVRITDTGQALIADLAVQAKRHEEEVLARLAPLDSEALKATLRRVIAEYREPI
ncbi:DNA-binding MarR family transcriptional regulator [Kerstersia gyiorum]|uniref:DNA-binding MarR family transcriptional regulator n=2 Tax=Kerstersia gyiorum TaxID=206506 RepID=A0A4V2EZR5_9BURK|nr:DNA-binding MarR family transcriptional regulator [Kerstersia gyiorum]